VASTIAVAGPFLDLGLVGRPLDARELFGSPLPLEIELGAGKGRFLLERAAAAPETGFIGVERCRKYASMIAERVARTSLANVRIVRTTAEDLLFRCLGDASVQAVHVYFPDPWPKKRHLKRRLFGATNVARIAEVLVPGGRLLVKTDHEGYAAVIAEVLAGEPRLAQVDSAEAFAGLPPTHYELKFAREGRAVHAFARQRA
jgi:tRNA (guanine-N7-)-methyltransferase